MALRDRKKYHTYSWACFSRVVSPSLQSCAIKYDRAVSRLSLAELLTMLSGYLSGVHVELCFVGEGNSSTRIWDLKEMVQICDVVRDTPFLRGIRVVDPPPLYMAGKDAGAPDVGPSGYPFTSAELFDYFQDRHRERILAFAMGLHPRLGSSKGRVDGMGKGGEEEGEGPSRPRTRSHSREVDLKRRWGNGACLVQLLDTAIVDLIGLMFYGLSLSQVHCLAMEKGISKECRDLMEKYDRVVVN